MNNENNNKVADNKIEEVTSNIKTINNKLAENRESLKNIEVTRELCVDVTKKFKRLLDLLYVSVKGPAITEMCDTISSQNAVSLVKIDEQLDLEKDNINKNIKELEKNLIEEQEKLKKSDKEKENN